MRSLARALAWVVVTSWLVATAPSASAQFAPWNWGWSPPKPSKESFSPDVFADYLGSGQPPHPAVVRIIAPENGGTSMGSGVLVDINPSQGLVLTNWHVIRGATSAVLVQFPDGFQTAGTVIRHDEPWDLAAVAIWRPRTVPIPIAPAPPAIGEPLSIAGYGKGPFRSEAGPCTQYLAPGSGYPLEFVELQATARRGDSGGPILNARGELAGILFGQAQGHTIGACSTRVQTFLASVGSKGLTPEMAASLRASLPADSGTVGAGGAAVPAAASLGMPSNAVPPTVPLSLPPEPASAPMPPAIAAAIGMAPQEASAPPAPLSPSSSGAVPAIRPSGNRSDFSLAPVPPVTSTAPVSQTIPPPPPAWGELPEGRPVGRTLDELLDVRANGRAILVAAGGAALTLFGLKTVLGGRRGGRGARRPTRDDWNGDD
jgi:S1-C subfamily serine protease